MLLLTGDSEFNHQLRMHAHEQGLHLTEYGLWRWGTDEVGGEAWISVPASTEEQVFRALKMKWVEPERRNYSHELSKKRKRKGRKLRRSKELLEILEAEGAPLREL
jgi:DNA polymerase/3'-5' exonuclease PolX